MSGSVSGAGPGRSKSTTVRIVEVSNHTCQSLKPGNEEIVRGDDLEELLDKLADLCGAEVEHG
jgi:hypothetical protein